MTNKVGGKRVNAGRPKGGTNKISGVSILKAVQRECGLPFEELLAQGYHKSIMEDDMHSRLSYEKMILSKVVADKHEIDHTTLGKSLHNNFVFPTHELADWSNTENVSFTTIPTTYTLDAK
jgi:hypothetical protein